MAEEKIVKEIVIDTNESIESLGKVRREIAAVLAQLGDKNLSGEQIDGLNQKLKELSDKAAKVEEAIGDAGDKLRTVTGNSVEKARASFGLLRESITNLDFGKFKIGLEGITGGFKAIGGAIKASGIGLLIVIVAQLIANFDKLKNIGGLVGKVFSAIGDTISFLIDGLKKLSDTFNLTNTALAETIEAEKKYRAEIDETNRQIGEERRKQLVATGKLTEAEATLANAKEQFKTDFKKIQAETREKIAEAENKFEIEKIKEAEAASLELLKQRYISEIKAVEKGEKDKAEAKRKAELEAAKKLEEERKAFIDKFTLKTELDKINNEEQAAIAEAKRLKIYEETKLGIQREFTTRRAKLAEQLGKDEKKTQEKTAKDIVETINGTIQEVKPIEYNVNLELLKAQLEIVSQVLTDYGQQTIDVFGSLSQTIADDRAADLEVEAINLEADYQRRKEYIEKNIADETARKNALAALDRETEKSRIDIEKKKIELDKQAIKRERNLTLAQVALSTGIAIANAVAATSKTDPVSFALSLAANLAAAGAAIVKANSALKKADASIAALGAGGGSSSSGTETSFTPSSSQTATQTPTSFALFGNNNNGQTNNLQPQLIQAYVVESDISNVQRRINRFRTASEL